MHGTANAAKNREKETLRERRDRREKGEIKQREREESERGERKSEVRFISSNQPNPQTGGQLNDGISDI